MGRRGPPKKPTELKLLQGVPGGEHKLVKDEPKPKKIQKARPPRELSREAKKIWKGISRKLERLGLLTEIDVTTLARYCDMTVRWNEAKKFLDHNGCYYNIYYEQSEEDRKAKREPILRYTAQYPQVSIYIRLARDLTRLEQQFGMTPASRAGINVAPTADELERDRDKLYGRR